MKWSSKPEVDDLAGVLLTTVVVKGPAGTIVELTPPDDLEAFPSHPYQPFSSEPLGVWVG